MFSSLISEGESSFHSALESKFSFCSVWRRRKSFVLTDWLALEMYQTRLSLNFNFIEVQDIFQYSQSISLILFSIQFNSSIDTEERPEASIKRTYNHNCKCSTFISLLFNASPTLSLSLSLLFGFYFFRFSFIHFRFFYRHMYTFSFFLSFGLMCLLRTHTSSLCRPDYLQAMGWLYK